MKALIEPGKICEEILMLDVMGWRHPKTNSSYLILGDKGAVVEPGSRNSSFVILKELKNLKLDPLFFRYVFVSHRHLDHSAGAPPLLKHLPRGVIAAHQYTVETLMNPSKINEAAKHFFGEYAEPIEKVEEVERLKVLKDRDLIELGKGLEVEVVSTPGHTSDHLSFYERKNKFMFTGDSAGIFNGKTLSVIPTTFPPSFKYRGYVKSIEKMLEYELEIVAFAHFGAVKGKDAYLILEKSLEVVEEWRHVSEELKGKGVNSIAETLEKRYKGNLEVFPPSIRAYIFSLLASGLYNGLFKF